MALTDAQLEKVMRWVARGLKASGVNPQDTGGVVKWMINNPLPSRAEIEAATDAADEADKQEYILRLEAELTKLKGGQ